MGDNNETAILRSEVTRLDHRIDKVEAKTDANKELVCALDKIVVRGNGKPSLLEEWRTVKTGLETLTKAFKDYADAAAEERRYWTRSIITIMLGQLAAGVVFAAVLLIQIAPVVEQLKSLPK